MNSPFTLSLISSDNSKAPYFFRVDTINSRILVNPMSKADIGNYTVVLKVSETKAPSFFNEYTLKIQVIESDSTGGDTNPSE